MAQKEKTAMSDQNTEEKNQTVDKGASDGVALDSVATHLSKAIDRLNSAEEQLNPHRFNQPGTFAIVSAAHSLIALTQIFSYQTNSLSTTSPRSNSAAAYSPEPDTDSQSQPTEDQSVHSATGASQPLAEPNEPTSLSLSAWSESQLKFLISNPNANPDFVTEAKAELARRESESFQTRNQAGNNLNEFIQDYQNFTSFNLKTDTRQPNQYQPIFENPKWSSTKYANIPDLTDAELHEYILYMSRCMEGDEFEKAQVEFYRRHSIRNLENQPKTYTFTRDELVDLVYMCDDADVEETVDAFLVQKEAAE